MTSALFWLITQRTVLIPYRRFGTTYQSHLQGSRSPSCPETSVRNCHYTLRNDPKERRSHLLRSEWLNSREEQMFVSCDGVVRNFTPLTAAMLKGAPTGGRYHLAKPAARLSSKSRVPLTTSARYPYKPLCSHSPITTLLSHRACV